MDVDRLFDSGRIGRLTIKNRLVRSATSETMSELDGKITGDYIELYRALARGGAGLILTGHMFVHPRGRYCARQAGLHDDFVIPRLKSLCAAVHNEGGVIFSELGHAGSQSRDPEVEPLAPSPVANFISARAPREASADEIEDTILRYGAAARRAVEAGFDGIHVHAGHGYLISEFSSPHGNRRTDIWGGDASRRSRFILSVYNAVRAAVGSGFPISIKLGIADSMESGGLEISESIERAIALENAGVNAIEVSIGIMHQLTRSAGRFVGLDLARAWQDMAFHRFFQTATPEAYFLPFAQALKPRLKRIPIVLVGGIRSTDTMIRILEDGDADFLSMARPFIREPDLPNQIRAGRRGFVDCISCNICMEYEGIAALQCWRVDKRMLLKHLFLQLKHGWLSL